MFDTQCLDDYYNSGGSASGGSTDPTPPASFSFDQGSPVTNDLLVSVLVDNANEVIIYSYDKNTQTQQRLDDADYQGSDTWEYDWDTTSVPDGEYKIRAFIKNSSGSYEEFSRYFDIENNNASKTDDEKNEDQNFFPDCLTITKVITDGHKNVTLDYGDGCLTRNDNFLSGIIIMDISYNNGDSSVNIDYSFDNFYFNNKKVEGEVHKFRIRENENGFPQATINRDIKIIWEDNSFVSITGERTREWIEGFNNDIWSDNVFLVTGTWTITYKDGTIRTATVIEPLKRVMACRFLVSGEVEIQKNDNSLTLNYGDGECDDLAEVTIGDTVHEIHLRKRR
jgi:hypothetical protein